MVAKERIPSAIFSQLLSSGGTEDKLTHCSNDLGLETELVLEATSKVVDTTLTVGLNIWDLADVVEHVSAREEQNSDQADGSPEVAVLNDRQKVRRGDGKEGEDTNDGGCHGDDLHVVDRALNGWVRRVGEMAAEPCVDGFGLVGAGRVVLGLSLDCHSDLDDSPRKEVKSGRRRVGLRIGSGGRVEEKQDGRGLKLHLLLLVSAGITIGSITKPHTDWKVALPSKKSNVANKSLPSPALSPLVQLRASKSYSGWKSLQRPHPNLASRAVRSTATE
jgi:hypothetical protein